MIRLKGCVNRVFDSRRTCSNKHVLQGPQKTLRLQPRLRLYSQKKKKQLFDIDEEWQRGNLWEIGQLKKFPNGKIFKGEEIAQDADLKWPPILQVGFSSKWFGGQRLDIESNPVNFIVLSQKRAFTSNQIEDWKKYITENHPEVPIYDVTVLNNYLYRFFNPLFAYTWEKKHGEMNKYMYLNNSVKPTVKGCGIDFENSFLSYQFLVDNEYNVRWRSVGMTDAEELKEMSTVIHKMSNGVKKE